MNEDIPISEPADLFLLTSPAASCGTLYPWISPTTAPAMGAVAFDLSEPAHVSKSGKMKSATTCRHVQMNK